MKVLKKMLKYLAYTFLSLLVALCLYTFVMTEILKQNYVNVFGYTYFVVATGSMSGTIEVNDIVIVKITDDYKVGQVITYIKEDSFITHRVISINDNLIVAKGDVNNVEDDPVSKDNVIGRVVFTFSLSFLFKLLGVTIILFVFLTLINFDKIFKKYIVKENKEIEDANIEKMKLIYQKDEEDAKLLNIILRIIQLKNNTIKDITQKEDNIIKFKYIYKLLTILTVDNDKELLNNINHQPFKEIYNYNFDNVGLDNDVINKLYDLNIYGFLKILVFSILYDDEEFFDGVFKVLKYKAKIDKHKEFILIDRTRIKEIMEIENLMNFMKQVSNQFKGANLLELDKVAEFVQLKEDINE